MTMEQTKPESTMQKFRRENRRIDYYPTEDAHLAIERLRKTKPAVCTREIIDMLVMAGNNAYFPKSKKVSG